MSAPGCDPRGDSTCGRVPTQAGCGAIPPRRSGESGSLRPRPTPGQDPSGRVRKVRGYEPSPVRGGQAGNIRLAGLHAFLHDDPARPLPAWSQTDHEMGQRNPGAHRPGSSQTLASRHPGDRRAAWTGLPRLALLLRRPGVEPVPAGLSPQAASPVDAGAAPAVPASPPRLEAAGAHDRNPLAACLHSPPLADQRFAVKHPG